MSARLAWLLWLLVVFLANVTVGVWRHDAFNIAMAVLVWLTMDRELDR